MATVSTNTGIPSTGDPTTDAEVQAVNQFINSLPDGELKTNIKKAMSTSMFAVVAHWISGYEYTGGDMALGEIFLNRVMGKQTSSRWDTPPAVVPVAWYYFTTLFGIPIAVNTDFDNIESGSLESYLTGRPEMRGTVTQEQVTRAKQLLDMLGHDNKMTQWPPTDFGVLPYVAPIPDARTPGRLFSGTLANGEQIQDGLPVSGTSATAGNSVSVPGHGSSSILIYVIIAIAIIILIIIITH